MPEDVWLQILQRVYETSHIPHASKDRDVVGVSLHGPRKEAVNLAARLDGVA